MYVRGRSPSRAAPERMAQRPSPPDDGGADDADPGTRRGQDGRLAPHESVLVRLDRSAMCAPGRSAPRAAPERTARQASPPGRQRRADDADPVTRRGQDGRLAPHQSVRVRLNRSAMYARGRSPPRAAPERTTQRPSPPGRQQCADDADPGTRRGQDGRPAPHQSERVRRQSQRSVRTGSIAAASRAGANDAASVATRTTTALAAYGSQS